MTSTTQLELDRLDEATQNYYNQFLNSHRQLPLSRHYDTTNRHPPEDHNFHGLREHHYRYTHESACRFMAYTEARNIRVDGSHSVSPQEVDSVQGHYGLYRIMDIQKSFYIAVACHQNLKEMEYIQVDRSCQLYIGDVLAVKDLGYTTGWVPIPSCYVLSYYRHKGPPHCEFVALQFSIFRREIQINQYILGVQKNVGVVNGSQIWIPGSIHIGKVCQGDIFYPEHFDPLAFCSGVQGPGPTVHSSIRKILNGTPTIISHSVVHPTREVYEDLRDQANRIDGTNRYDSRFIDYGCKIHDNILVGPHEIPWPVGTRVLVGFKNWEVEGKVLRAPDGRSRLRILESCRDDAKSSAIVQMLGVDGSYKNRRRGSSEHLGSQDNYGDRQDNRRGSESVSAPQDRYGSHESTTSDESYQDSEKDFRDFMGSYGRSGSQSHLGNRQDHFGDSYNRNRSPDRGGAYQDHGRRSPDHFGSRDHYESRDRSGPKDHFGSQNGRDDHYGSQNHFEDRYHQSTSSNSGGAYQHHQRGSQNHLGSESHFESRDRNGNYPDHRNGTRDRPEDPSDHFGSTNQFGSENHSGSHHRSGDQRDQSRSHDYPWDRQTRSTSQEAPRDYPDSSDDSEPRHRFGPEDHPYASHLLSHPIVCVDISDSASSDSDSASPDPNPASFALMISAALYLLDQDKKIRSTQILVAPTPEETRQLADEVTYQIKSPDGPHLDILRYLPNRSDRPHATLKIDLSLRLEEKIKHILQYPRLYRSLDVLQAALNLDVRRHPLFQFNRHVPQRRLIGWQEWYLSRYRPDILITTVDGLLEVAQWLRLVDSVQVWVGTSPKGLREFSLKELMNKIPGVRWGLIGNRLESSNFKRFLELYPSLTLDPSGSPGEVVYPNGSGGSSRGNRDPRGSGTSERSEHPARSSGGPEVPESTRRSSGSLDRHEHPEWSPRSSEDHESPVRSQKVRGPLRDPGWSQRSSEDHESPARSQKVRGPLRDPGWSQTARKGSDSSISSLEDRGHSRWTSDDSEDSEEQRDSKWSSVPPGGGHGLPVEPRMVPEASKQPQEASNSPNAHERPRWSPELSGPREHTELSERSPAPPGGGHELPAEPKFAPEASEQRQEALNSPNACEHLDSPKWSSPPTASQLESVLVPSPHPLSYLLSRPGMFPDPTYPFLLIENTCKDDTKQERNSREQFVLQNLLRGLLGEKGEIPISPADLGVLCLEKNQLQELRRDKEAFKFGVIDSFEPKELKVLVVCCSNYKKGAFELIQNRLGTILGISKQATIIVGNVKEMEKADGWNQLVEKIKAKRCYFEYPIEEQDGGVPAGNLKNSESFGAGGHKKTMEELEMVYFLDSERSSPVNDVESNGSGLANPDVPDSPLKPKDQMESTQDDTYSDRTESSSSTSNNGRVMDDDEDCYYDAVEPDQEPESKAMLEPKSEEPMEKENQENHNQDDVLNRIQ